MAAKASSRRPMSQCSPTAVCPIPAITTSVMFYLRLGGRVGLSDSEIRIETTRFMSFITCLLLLGLDTPSAVASSYSNSGEWLLFPHALQKFDLLQCLITLTTFMTVVWIDFDIFLASPIIVRGVHG